MSFKCPLGHGSMRQDENRYFCTICNSEFPKFTKVEKVIKKSKKEKEDIQKDLVEEFEDQILTEE